MDGFDLKSPLVCEGVIGDGCGGGRLFYIEDDSLKTYDPQTQESMTLITDVKDAKSIKKKKCIIYIKCISKTIEFDLSLVP
ncbi:thiamine biosynthesis protein ThiF [Sulfurimonas sp.]|jgi:hypothetical protein|uniref:thiamine biosynthesis protein ThiF n=1 Tax=Sulfurimonas sp. TaxID=2022749 RepID=UPI0025CC2A82|nr:thiamine biosynthesis protein ThiF [Sulfurimonas sp.]MBT5934688.1 thiamine biosynthesis protein ThiF [Sulfurimonas sp.]